MFSLEDNFTFETPFEGFVNDEFLYSGGLNVNVYPLGQRNVSYFVGPGFRSGKTFSYRYDSHYRLTVRESQLFYHLYFTNGFHANITNVFGVSSYLSIGLREEIGSGPVYPMPLWGTSINLRF